MLAGIAVLAPSIGIPITWILGEEKIVEYPNPGLPDWGLDEGNNGVGGGPINPGVNFYNYELILKLINEFIEYEWGINISAVETHLILSSDEWFYSQESGRAEYDENIGSSIYINNEIELYDLLNVTGELNNLVIDLRGDRIEMGSNELNFKDIPYVSISDSVILLDERQDKILQASDKLYLDNTVTNVEIEFPSPVNYDMNRENSQFVGINSSFDFNNNFNDVPNPREQTTFFVEEDPYNDKELIFNPVLDLYVENISITNLLDVNWGEYTLKHDINSNYTSSSTFVNENQILNKSSTWKFVNSILV